MSNLEETLEKSTLNEPILQAITELSKKIDGYKQESDAQFESLQKRFELVDNQFEAVRQGIVHNSVAFDRMKAEVLLLRADVKELAEEVRHNKKVLI